MSNANDLPSGDLNAFRLQLARRAEHVLENVLHAADSLENALDVLHGTLSRWDRRTQVPPEAAIEAIAVADDQYRRLRSLWMHLLVAQDIVFEAEGAVSVLAGASEDNGDEAGAAG